MANKKENEPNNEEFQAPQVYVNTEMAQSIDVLIQGVEMAQKAGVYTFQDSTIIGQAVNILSPYRIK